MTSEQFVPHNPVDVESFIKAFIADSGGEILDETLDGSPNFENADFVFRNEGVVIELKTIQEDFVSPAVRERASRIVEQMVASGEISHDQSLRLNSLPELQMKELLQPFRKPLERKVEKANTLMATNVNRP